MVNFSERCTLVLTHKIIMGFSKRSSVLVLAQDFKFVHIGKNNKAAPTFLI